MKKILLFVLATLFAYTMNAQVLLNEGFEDGIPGTWTVIDNDGDGLNWSDGATILPDWNMDAADYCNSGSNMAMSISYDNATYDSYTPDNYLVTPQISVPASGATLSFFVKSIASSYLDGYAVKLSTTGNAAADFTVELQALADAAASWTSVEIDLAAYAGQNVYIAFIHQANDKLALLLDDVKVYSFASTPEITLNSVTLPSYAYAGEGFDVSGTVLNVSQNALTSFDVTYNVDGGTESATFSVTGINVAAGETYDFTHNVQAVVATGGNHTVNMTVSNPNGTADITTDNTNSASLTIYDCTAAISDFPYTQDFEEGLVPSCWRAPEVGNGAWSNAYYYIQQYGSGSFYNLPFEAHTGDNSLLSAADDQETVNWLISPAISIPADASAIGFKYYDYLSYDPNEAGSTSYSVMVSTTGHDPADFTTTLATFTVSENSFTERTVDLAAYAGQTIYVALKHTVDAWLIVDDVTIEAASNNPEIELTSIDIPSSVSTGTEFNVSGVITNKGGVALNSFKVQYTIDGNASEVYTISGQNIAYSETYEFTHNVPATIADAGVHTITVTVSEPNGEADNTEDNSLSTNITACGIINALPYEEGFENGIGCWTAISNNTENADVENRGLGVVDASTFTQGVNGGESCFIFSSYSQATDYTQYLISPELNIGTAFQFSFYYTVKSTSYAESCQIMYSNTTNDPASFIEVGDAINATANTWEQASVLIPADAKYVAIKYTSNYAWFLGIDDIAMTEVSNDPEIALTAITTPTIATEGTTVNVSGIVTNNSGAELNSFDVAYTFDGTASSTYNVTGINVAAGATYNFTHNAPISNITAGAHTLVVTVSNPNATADNTADNSLTITITACGAEDAPYTETFDNGSGCWLTVDGDGDGKTWMTMGEWLSDVRGSSTDPGTYCYGGTGNAMISESYRGSALSPDNWLISPAINIPAEGTYAATWYEKSQDGDYLDSYSVYVGTSSDIETLAAGASVYSGEAPAEFTQQSTLLSDFAGQTIYVAFRHHDVTDKFVLIIDQFEVRAVSTTPEIALTEVSAPSTVAMNTAYVVNGTVVNNCVNALTSFDVACTVNGQTTNQQITGINVPFLQSYSFAIDMPGVATADDYTVTLTVSNPNGEADNTEDNTMTTTVNIYDASTSVPRTVLLENFTTSQCPNCPSGHERIEEAIGTTYTDNVIWVAHHSGYYNDQDFLAIDLDETMTVFFNNPYTFAPAMMLDRTYWGDQVFITDDEPGPAFFPSTEVSDIETAFATATAVPAFVTVNVGNPNYNATTRALSVTVNGEVTGSLGTSDARLNVWLLEDGLVGDGSETVGHGPTQSGATGTFIHNHVIRENLSGDDWGEAGVVTATAGSTYTKTYTTTVSNNYDASKCYIVAFVSNGNHSDINNCKVFNAGKSGYLSAGEDPQPEQVTITVVANPTEGGTVAINGNGTTATVEAGTTVNVTATPATGYHFVSWSDGGAQTHTVTVNNNMSLTATFAQDGGEQPGDNGIDDVTAANVKLYPNPTTGNLFVEVEGLKKVEVIDAVGRVVMTQTTGNSVNMSTLANGIYTVRVTTNAGTAIKKVVKK